MNNSEEGTHYIPNGSSSFTLYASESFDLSNMQQWKHLDCLNCLSIPFSYIQLQWNTIEYFDYIYSIALLFIPCDNSAPSWKARPRDYL